MLPVETPFSALALAKAGIHAGVPAGVFGRSSAGAVGRLTSNPLVRKQEHLPAFDQELAAGYRQCAKAFMKKASRLGGNAVADDADLDTKRGRTGLARPNFVCANTYGCVVYSLCRKIAAGSEQTTHRRRLEKKALILGR